MSYSVIMNANCSIMTFFFFEGEEELKIYYYIYYCFVFNISIKMKIYYFVFGYHLISSHITIPFIISTLNAYLTYRPYINIYYFIIHSAFSDQIDQQNYHVH